MLEYFTYKKYKKHEEKKHSREPSREHHERRDGPEAATSSRRAERTEAGSPVLSEDDENFLRRVVSEEGTPPPMPPRPVVLNEAELQRGIDSEPYDTTTGHEHHRRSRSFSKDHGLEQTATRTSTKSKDKGKGKENVKPHENTALKRFSSLFQKKPKTATDVSPAEKAREEDDLTNILNELNMSAVNNKAFSMSKESQELVEQFKFVLKDLVNGVPTAYDDLVHLLDQGNSTLADNYEKLPGFLQKLVMQLPHKLTGSLAPELLAVAAESQGVNMKNTKGGKDGGLMGAAKGFLKPNSLKDLVTKPGAIAGLLRGVMNALKLRWPAFMGTNVLLSLGLFGKSTPLLASIFRKLYANQSQSSSSSSGTATSAAAKSASARTASSRSSRATAASSSWTMTQRSKKPGHRASLTTGGSVRATAAAATPARVGGTAMAVALAITHPRRRARIGGDTTIAAIRRREMTETGRGRGRGRSGGVGRRSTEVIRRGAAMGTETTTGVSAGSERVPLRVMPHDCDNDERVNEWHDMNMI
jgi:hypothetical protein